MPRGAPSPPLRALATAALGALAAGSAALVVARGYGVVHVAVLVPAFAYALAGARGWLSWRAPSRLLSLAAGLYPFVLAADLLLSGTLIVPCVRLLLFLAVVKLLSAHDVRDHAQLVLLGLLDVIAAAALTTDLAYLLPLLGFLLCTSRALSLIALVAARPATASRGGAEPAYGGWGRAAAATAVVFSGGLVLFALLPHFGTGYVPGFVREQNAVSGFAEKVQLGDVGRIERSYRTVLRAWVDAAPGAAREELYWRGTAFDRYDGRTWTRTSRGARVDHRRRDDFHRFARPEPPLVEQRILLEPTGGRTLFAAGRVVELRGPDLGRVHVGPFGTLQLRSTPGKRVEYRVISHVARPPAQELRAAGADYPDDVANGFLDLPPLDRRVAELARALTAAAATPYDAAAAVERHLRARYGYSLDLSARGSADPMVWFLVEGNAAHCEYFATAMALLLRAAGVPTRVAGGYLSGEYSWLQGHYTVREADAHTWVEVFFPGHGWVAFDPTPPAPGEGQGVLGLRSVLGELRTWAELTWDSYVIALDLRDQQAIVLEIRDRLAALGGAVASGFHAGVAAARDAHASLAAAALLAAVAAAAGLLAQRRARRRPPRAAAPPPGRGPVVREYRRALRRLSRRGLRRTAGQTPREFVAAAAAQLGDAAALEELTELYYRARWAPAAPPSDVERARELRRRLADDARR